MTDDPDLQPVLPEDRVELESEQVRYFGLILAALVGAVMVAGSIYWNVVRGRDDILPSVLLELGAGTILFVVLFGVERSAVRKVVRLETDRLYRAMAPNAQGDQQEAEQAVAEEASQLGLPPGSLWREVERAW